MLDRRDTHSDISESSKDRNFNSAMDRASQPSAFLIWLLFALIVYTGWLAPQYVADPTTMERPWRRVVATALAVVVFAAFSTLNFTAYSLLFARGSESARKLIMAVANRAAIGAILGALLGLRMATMMVRAPSGAERVTFLGFESNLSNAITLFTLILIATAWPYCWGPLREAFSGAAKGPLERYKTKIALVLGVFVVIGTHKLGFGIAFAVYRGVMNG
ncbi:hypothetical protein ABTW72_03170 [Micromonospora sp. NPDC127501]|uniref:hypothetical protein n=1 Tax=Micromonospora sp. NPDC127501 TaxID=3154872 RepID=UPI0033209524